MIEIFDKSDRRRHLSDHGTVMMVGLLSVGTTVMRVIGLVVGAGVDLPQKVKIETGTGTGTVFAMTGTGMIGIGIEYEIGNHLKEIEITVIGTVAERGTAKENETEMIIVDDVPLLETGVRTEVVTVTMNDFEREAVAGIETVNENVNEKDPERRKEIANVTVIEKNLEKRIEIARGSETGCGHPPNHTAAHPRGNGHGPEQAAAPLASSTSTVTSRQQAVEVDPRVDGCALQTDLTGLTGLTDLTDLIDQNGTTVDELIDISPAVLLAQAGNVRESAKEIGSQKKREMFRKGGVRIAVADGNPNDLCTCIIIVGCIIEGLVYEREVYILISNDDDKQRIGGLCSSTDALYNTIQDELQKNELCE